jgi:ribosomal protein L32
VNAILNQALDYYAHDWMPIPIPHRSKNPNRKGWQKERWAQDDLPHCFNNGQNIGLLLGQPSGGLVDVDLDSREAISIADALLPVTGMVSGRTSSPFSHRWYICDPLVATVKFLDPALAYTDDRAMILELRSTGGQTLVPPSIHPTGEIYEWYGELSPSQISGDDLLKAVSQLAACALVARHWKHGQRHNTSLALAGTLLRAGWLRNSVERFIRLVATAANDVEHDDRVRAVETTEQKIIIGEKATGLPSLADLIGKKVVARLQEWLRLNVVGECASEGDQADLIKTICLADVKPEQVDFLWHPYIPKGKLTLIEGDPGVGKSWLTCAFATATAAGAGPTGWMQNTPGNVLMLSIEDGLADTIRPRLDTMQADVTRIFAIPDTLILNDSGLLQIESKIITLKPMLVVIDPLVAYLGAGVDIHRANETRAVMAKLAMLAEKYHCAIIAVRHLTKGGKDRPIYRGIGSIDFTAACRSVLLVGSDPDNPNSRAVVHIKSNLSKMGGAVGYDIREGVFFWTGASTLTAGRIFASQGNEEERSAIGTAEDFLREALSGGPRPSKELQRQAREAGISKATLDRAKQVLGVKAQKEGRPGEKEQRWIWMLAEYAEDYHEGYQRKMRDDLRTSNTDNAINTSHLAEDYHSSVSDDLRAADDNLRAQTELTNCINCGSSGISHTHCNRCGEFLR